MGDASSSYANPLTHLVGDLVAEDRHGGCHAALGGGGEGGADDQTISKVMEAVAHDNHDGEQWHHVPWVGGETQEQRFLEDHS